MVLLKSHKVLLGISVTGLLIAIAVFVSPGWFRVHYYKIERTYGDDIVYPEGEHHGKEPVAMAKRSARKHHHHDHDHHHDHHHGHHHDEESMPPGTRKIHISCGLWYFSTCVCGRDLNGKRIKKCQYSTYCKAKENAHNLPKELQGAGLESVYTNIGQIAKYGLMEFQIEATAAIICLLVGTLSAVGYLRSNGHKRCCGLTTVITHIMAGVLFAVVVGKFATVVIQAKMLTENYYDYDMNHLKFHVPYSLIMAGVSALATLISALALLVILSKGARPNVAEITCTGKKPGRPFGVISPNGYQPFHGLTEPPPYKRELSLDEQAEPLPQKEAI